MNRNNKRGFTLAELLIVVAIIAVLVAISIPIFTTQLEKSREATDLANVRSAYAQMMNEMMDTDAMIGTVSVPLVQKKDGWTTKPPLNIAGVTYNGSETNNWRGQPMNNGSCIITYDAELDLLIFNWNGGNIATNLGIQEGCWNGPATASNRQLGKMISTYNTGNSKYEGLYELEGGTKYKVSFTYNPYLDDPDHPTKGIIGRAILLFDSNRNNVLDTGSGSFNIGKDNVSKGVTYNYTKNNDGTLTYTATFTTPKSDEQYYFGMNFGGRKISSNGSTSGDLDFSVMGKNARDDLEKQLKTSFTIEKMK